MMLRASAVLVKVLSMVVSMVVEVHAQHVLLPTELAVPPARTASALSAAVGMRPASAADAVQAAAAPSARARDVQPLWGWPLAGQPEIVRHYAPPAQRWRPGHRGIDLAGVVGEPVLAVDDGVVSHSGQIAGVGTISVTHASGLRSTYQPVTDRLSRGSRVSRGDQIGTLDVGGHCTIQSCLHLGAKYAKHDYVDPTPLLIGLELTLLPMG